MKVIFSQQLILFLFIAVGYLLSKTGKLKEDQSRILSGVLVYVFLPCNIFKTFSTNFTVSYIGENYKLLLLSAAVLVTVFVGAHFAAKLFTKDKYERNILEYSMSIPNYGYMGYALAEALLGETGLMNIMTFAIPASIYIYTIGFAMLTKRGLSLKKLCNPPMIATVLGIAAGLCGFKTPEVLASVLAKASGCMAPVSMLLTGIVISGFSLKKILFHRNIYPLAAIRLVVLPLLVGFVLSRFCDRATVQVVVLFMALPCGLNTVVFPKLVDENCELGAGIALVSTVLACATLPVVLSLFGIGVIGQ